MDAGIDVVQGHLSSFDFVPSWLYTWHDKNMFNRSTGARGVRSRSSTGSVGR